jgi:hypothetical protein
MVREVAELTSIALLCSGCQSSAPEYPQSLEFVNCSLKIRGDVFPCKLEKMSNFSRLKIIEGRRRSVKGG